MEKLTKCHDSGWKIGAGAPAVPGEDFFGCPEKVSCCHQRYYFRFSEPCSRIPSNCLGEQPSTLTSVQAILLQPRTQRSKHNPRLSEYYSRKSYPTSRLTSNIDHDTWRRRRIKSKTLLRSLLRQLQLLSDMRLLLRKDWRLLHQLWSLLQARRTVPGLLLLWSDMRRKRLLQHSDPGLLPFDLGRVPV